jgi:Rieske Fe-S protein
VIRTSHRDSGPSPTSKEGIMARCEICGNDYDRCFEVVTGGVRHVFDSFECAIQKLAPVCKHCGCKIIGHGIEANGVYFCCAHCARQAGVTKAVDHAG